MFDYIRDPVEIHKRSFETVRAETDVSGLSADEAALTVRLVHACGMPDIVRNLVFGPGALKVGRAALGEGAAILTDVEMVRHGIIRAQLPADNPVLCIGGGVSKIKPLRAALRGRLIDGLITDEITAAELISR